MENNAIPHFQNDRGVSRIEIGTKELMCCGASAPYDHPHVFLDMGDDKEIVCPYCSTLFSYNASLETRESNPQGCLYDKIAL
jgi:uncharacterized Zn-finger protein